MNCFQRQFRRSLHFDSEGGGGGGGSSSGDGVSQEELERQAQQAVEDGRALQKITQLLQDNYEQREQLRELRGQMPAEDAVVLSPDEADDLQELGALDEEGNVQADDVQERLENAEDAEEELQRYRRRDQRRQVYGVTGLNEAAAEDILPDDLEFEVEEGNGEDEEDQAFVKTEDGRTPVEEYVEENYSSPIQNALYEDESSGGGEGGGKSVPEQTPGGEDSPGDSEPDPDEMKEQQADDVGYQL